MKKFLALLFALMLCFSCFANALAENITITIFHYNDDDTKRAALEAVEQAFQVLYPEVTFENVCYNQGKDYFPQLQTALASGDQPELIMGNPSVYPDLITEGYAMDLTDNAVLASMQLSEGDLADCVYEGRVYALPIDYKSSGMFYNPAVFAANGIEVPTTFSELIAVCEKLSSNGINPFADAYSSGVYVDIIMRPFIWAAAANAGEYTYFEKLMDGTAKFADYPFVKDGLEKWAQLLAFCSPDALTNDESTLNVLFTSCERAMMSNGSWCIGGVESIAPEDFEYSFFIIPYSDDASQTKMPLQVSTSFMVNPYSKNVEMGLKFMEFWATDGALIWSEKAQMPLCSGEGGDNLSLTLQSIAQSKAEGKTVSYSSFTKTLTSEFTSAWRTGLMTFAQDVLDDGTYDVDAAVANLQSLFDNVIATSF